MIGCGALLRECGPLLATLLAAFSHALCPCSRIGVELAAVVFGMELATVAR